MTVLFKNNVTASLAASISSSTTTIVVSSGQGARFPAVPAGSYFYATLYDASNNIEIIKVTARSTDTLTVVRGQDSTSARTYAAGDSIAMRVVAAAMTDLVAYTPTGNLSATDLSGAVTELDSEKAGLALNNTFTGNNTFSNNVTLTGGATGNLTGNADTATVAQRLANSVPVTSGGTGKNTLTLNSLVTGNGNYPVNQVAPGTAGNVLSSVEYGAAVVVGSIATGTLTVTSITSGTLTEGATISGTSVTAGTTINQLTSSASAVANPTFVSGGAPSQNTLVVSSASGLVAGQLVIGTGVPANTFLQSIIGTTATLTRNLTAQAAGSYSFYTPGGLGTYTTTPSQTVTSTTITATNGTQWTSTLPQSQYIKGQMFAPASFVGTINGTLLTVTSMNYGVINFGNTVYGSGITGNPAIAAFGTGGTTGTGGTGTYTLTVSQGVLSSFTMNNGTGSGTFVVPSLVSGLKVTASGGGGGSGGSANYGYYNAGSGTSGGTTSFGSYMTVTGGGGGGPGNSGNAGSTGATGKSAQAYYGLSAIFKRTDGATTEYGVPAVGVYTQGTGCCPPTSYSGSGGASVTSVANITPPTAGTSITVTVGAGGSAGGGGGYGSAGNAGNQGFCLIEW